MTRQISDLPHALGEGEVLARRFAGKQVAVFLDYDGTLTPICDRPENAVISDSMREAVRRLAERVPVCVISGRDRKVVQELMGLDNLIVAGSHGFDIWSPASGSIQREEGASFEGLLREVEAQLSRRTGRPSGRPDRTEKEFGGGAFPSGTGRAAPPRQGDR